MKKSPFTLLVALCAVSVFFLIGGCDEKKLLLLDAIKNDTRVQILNCDKYSDENGDAPATQKYSVEKSLFGQTPLISGSEITCELGKDVSEKQLARVMAIENGVINGIDYTLFHSDASGSVGQNNAEWQVVCEKDAMTDAQIVQRRKPRFISL